MNDFYELKTIDGQMGIIDDCPICGVRHHIPIVTQTETITYKGRALAIDVDSLYCPSADEYFANGYMLNKMLAAIKEEYKKVSGEK